MTRANSVYCRSHSVLREAKARRGELPEPALGRLVTIVVEAEQADALFELLYERADIHRPGGGVLLMTPVTFATPFALPEGIAQEKRVSVLRIAANLAVLFRHRQPASAAGSLHAPDSHVPWAGRVAPVPPDLA